MKQCVAERKKAQLGAPDCTLLLRGNRMRRHAAHAAPPLQDKVAEGMSRSLGSPALGSEAEVIGGDRLPPNNRVRPFNSYLGGASMNTDMASSFSREAWERNAAAYQA